MSSKDDEMPSLCSLPIIDIGEVLKYCRKNGQKLKEIKSSPQSIVMSPELQIDVKKEMVSPTGCELAPFDPTIQNEEAGAIDFDMSREISAILNDDDSLWVTINENSGYGEKSSTPVDLDVSKVFNLSQLGESLDHNEANSSIGENLTLEDEVFPLKVASSSSQSEAKASVQVETQAGPSTQQEAHNTFKTPEIPVGASVSDYLPILMALKARLEVILINFL